MHATFFNRPDSQDSFKNWEQLTARTDLKTATFAGGCFWCLVPPFKHQPGVAGVISGYIGGDLDQPTYQDVIDGTTQSREGVQIFYDPTQMTYQQLLDIFWLQIDPTDPGGQFADRGFQYTTAIYTHTPDQHQAAQASKIAKEQSGIYDQPIATVIEPFISFYPAEDYHQDYAYKEPTHYQQYAALSGRKEYQEKIKTKLEK